MYIICTIFFSVILRRSKIKLNYESKPDDYKDILYYYLKNKEVFYSTETQQHLSFIHICNNRWCEVRLPAIMALYSGVKLHLPRFILWPK